MATKMAMKMAMQHVAQMIYDGVDSEKTQKQFQTWIAKSSKYADESFKGYGQSQAGALKAMTVARQKLEQEFTKPIFDAKTSGLQALKNIMTSKEVMAGA